jgi:hypothetical protein
LPLVFSLNLFLEIRLFEILIELFYLIDTI